MRTRVQRESSRSRLFRSAAWAVLASGTFAAAAHAQIAPAASSNEPATVETVVVTAQRRSENIQNVPVSVQALTSRDLQTSGVKITDDLGQITPNVTIVNPEGAGNQPLITIRGIGLNDFDTNNAGPNGVYVDDVYISAPSAQSFAVFDLNQVEVLKGPQGTLYGRNTSGGAIVFTSKRPTDEFTTDLHAEYGNYNTSQIAAAVGGPIVDHLDGRISLVYNHSDGYMHNLLNGEPASGANNGAARLQLLWKPTDQLKVYFESTVGYVYNQPIEYRHVGVYVPGTQSSASPVFCTPQQAFAGGCVDLFGYGTQPGYYDGEWNRTSKLRSVNLINQFRVDYSIGKITLTSITSTQYNDKREPEDSDAGPNSLLAVDYGVKSHAYTQEFRASYNSEHFNWVAGAYYLHENLYQDQPLYLFQTGDLFGGFGIPPGPGAFDGIAQRSYDFSAQVTNSEAIYGQGDYRLGNLTLTLGGRYTWEHKTFNYYGSTQFQAGGMGNYGPLQDIITDDESQSVSNFTYRAALTYHFTPRVLAYGSVATGFKSGDFNGSFLSNDPQQALLQLKPVLPEHVTAYEIGTKTSFFDQRMVFNAALFYNRYHDEQIFASVPQILDTAAGPIESVTQVLTNADKAHTEGVELQFTAVPFRGLTINLQPAWLNAVIDHAGLPLFAGVAPLDGKQLANAPHVTFTGTVDYRLPLSNGDTLAFRWNSNYRSHSWIDSTNDPYIQQPGYWLHNLNVAYESRQGWELGAFVRNITGTEYAVTSTDLSNPFGVLTPVIGPPRMYGVEVTYHY